MKNYLKISFLIFNFIILISCEYPSLQNEKGVSQNIQKVKVVIHTSDKDDIKFKEENNSKNKIPLNKSKKANNYQKFRTYKAYSEE